MPEETAREALIIAWQLPNDTRCFVGERQGRWVVIIEANGAVVARSEFSTATQALAEAERRQAVFLAESREPAP